MSDLASSTPGSSTTGESSASATALVIAGLCAAAGVIHFAMVPSHAGGSLIDPLGFAMVGWFQLAIAGIVLSGRARRGTWIAAAVGNLAVAAIWVYSRTKGLPVGSHQGIVEDFSFVDVTCNAFGIGAAVLSLRLILAPAAGHSERMPRLAPALFGIAALGIATTVITSPEAANHGHANTTTVDAMTAQMAQITQTRCDKDLNIPAYWREADLLGIDTYEGGNMVMDGSTAAATTSSDGHNHAHGASTAAPVSTTTTRPDPTQGRGSATLDRLTTMTEGAGTSEAAAAQLMIALGQATDQEYGNWLWWLRSSGLLNHSHGATGDDTGGHGGHVGPQPWVAMTSQAQCDKLDAELAEARAVALAHPHPGDAEADGWRKVTGYVPGIAAHYMKYAAVDDVFDVSEPEMLLYDGDGPDANIVGLSYYILHSGNTEPTQGFTGPNDHFHRHVGLCMKNGVVIGDSQTSAEECAAAGGGKSTGDRGWMNHVWIVPGCESPWGMFSAATPLLEGELGQNSGTDGGGCAGSSVRDRYQMDSVQASSLRSGN